LRFNTIDNPEALISLQEVLHEQLVDILDGLNGEDGSLTDSGSEPEWSYIGVGRDDGKQDGEYSPILYRPAVWELSNFTTVWLSPTPDVPSLGWDAGSIRILTIGDFVHKQTGIQLIAMNTHLDNAGTVSRQNSAEIITNEINKRIANTTDDRKGPVLYLTGDFNSEPGQEAYEYMTREQSPVYDERSVIPEEERYGHRTGTFTDFSPEEEVTLLDFIFLQKTSLWRPRTYAVLENVYDDGVYLSDHRAVVADVELQL